MDSAQISINFSNDTTAFGVPYDYFYTSTYFVHYEYDVITDQDGEFRVRPTSRLAATPR